MFGRLRWQMVSNMVVILLAIAGGLYFGIHGETPWVGVLVGLLILFFGIIARLILTAYIRLLIGRSALTDALLDSLLAYVRKHPETGAGFIITTAVLFLVLNAIWMITIHQAPPEIAIGFIKTTLVFELLLSLAVILGVVIWFQAHITASLQLTSSLADQIAPELMVQNPQAAVEHAFTIFEDDLRKRIGAGPDVHGENLINRAYGSKGCLVYGAVESEQQGIRNLMSGAYATFRNPRKHRVIEDDQEIAKAIVFVVDLLMRLVDESEDRTISS